jgi:aerotaxis receptor
VGSDSWLATPWVGGLPASKASVEVEPLALSVTDENGVVTDVNDVFIAWTRFSRERLLGSAHSIVRHPGMPGGLFKLIWDRLKVGKPVCAYLQNLPADGNTYTALVTISPTLGGYLAVEQKPCRPEAAEAVQKLYSSVRSAEFQARDDGVDATVAVQRGTELLVDLLRQLGFSSYDDFMWTALPQEVDEYCRRAPGPQAAGVDDGSPAAAVLAASNDLARELLPWSFQQAELLRTWGSLSKTLVSLKPMMEEAKRAADSISEEIEQDTGFNAMRLSITVWASMIAEIEKVITDLPNDLLALRQACAQTRFWIGLAQIHTEMIGQFAADFSDAEVLERSRGAVAQLCTTLDRDFDDLSWRMEKNARFAATVAERIQSLHDLLAMPRDLIGNWKAMTPGRDDAFVTRLLPEVDRQLTLAGETLGMLQTLADQCLAIAIVQPMDTAHQCVRRIQRSVAYAPEQEPLRVTAQAAEPRQDGPSSPRTVATRPTVPAGRPAASAGYPTPPGGHQAAPAYPAAPPPRQVAPAYPAAAAPRQAAPVGRPLTADPPRPVQSPPPPTPAFQGRPRQSPGPSPDASSDRGPFPGHPTPGGRLAPAAASGGPLSQSSPVTQPSRPSMPTYATGPVAPAYGNSPASYGTTSVASRPTSPTTAPPFSTPGPASADAGGQTSYRGTWDELPQRVPREPAIDSTWPTIPDVYAQLGSDDTPPRPAPPSVYSQLPQNP